MREVASLIRTCAHRSPNSETRRHDSYIAGHSDPDIYNILLYISMLLCTECNR